MNPARSPVHWAETARLNQAERDCITAVVLKVLDAKCKMPAAQQEAILAIYDTVERDRDGPLGTEIHHAIDQARSDTRMAAPLREQIHQFRLEAETLIAKPTMKAFKARLRCELFERNP